MSLVLLNLRGPWHSMRSRTETWCKLKLKEARNIHKADTLPFGGEECLHCKYYQTASREHGKNRNLHKVRKAAR